MVFNSARNRDCGNAEPVPVGGRAIVSLTRRLAKLFDPQEALPPPLKKLTGLGFLFLTMNSSCRSSCGLAFSIATRQKGTNLMTQPLNWGILGTGMIAHKFAAELKDTSSGALVASGSRRQETADAFAAEHGGRGVPGYAALLDDPKVDAVYNSLPNGLHAERSIRAMEAGKHVLCEKPMACNAAEAESMFDAAERTGQLLVEAFMYRTLPAVKTLIEMVQGGALGQVKLIRSNFSFAREALVSDARYQAAQAGGGLMDVGCYCVNLTRAVMASEPTDTACFAHLHEHGVDDYAAGVMRFGDNTLATFTCGMTVANNWTTYIAGDDGEIAINDPWLGDGTFTLNKDGETQTVGAKTDTPVYALEAEAFAEAVAGATPWITREDTLGNMRVLDKLREQAGVPVPD